jgi:S1-C subfamily serine protease
VYSRYQGSIAHFTTTNCSDRKQYVGSGFVVAPNLVVTAAHVVNGHRIDELAIGGHVVPGHTIGVDAARDIALVQLGRSVSAAVVPLATRWPAVGSPLAVMGYALDGPLSMQQGHVSAVDVTVNDGPGFLVTDTAEDHGSSGGPVLDTSGHAVAIVSASIGDAGLVHLEAGSIGAAQLVGRWRTSPQAVPARC